MEEIASEDPSSREFAEALAAQSPKVEVPPHLSWIWRAWHRLSVDRPFVSGGLGPSTPLRIPWRDLVLWCEVHCYSTEDLWFLEKCCNALDRVYLEWWRSKTKK